jgi:A/G-specific adenine glycosylase
MILVSEFQQLVWDYYNHNKRAMPWRENTSLYFVLVSEIMLQQTQVATVIPKFLNFIAIFPDWSSLASAETKILLAAWSGLGYNTRALRLRECAKQLSQMGNKTLTIEQLDALPGIGPATASAIITYVYNQPVVFIETNIRRIMIYHFFLNKVLVSDREILPWIEKTLDTSNPREWYWALMDYGSYLKKTVPNPNRRSSNYSKQSKFKGSVREVRGEILRRLQKLEVSKQLILEEFNDRGVKAIDGLIKDNIIIVKNGLLELV